MAILIGTTNIDGTGTSKNLTKDNTTYIQEDSYLLWNKSGITIACTDHDDLIKLDKIIINSDQWNKIGYKEANISSNSTFIDINNIVDVNIFNKSESGFSTLNITNVKRGQIDTSNSASSDTINIGVKSNSDSWSNTFDIDTGRGDDTVTLENIEGSQYTEFSINVGKGNDIVDLSQLSAASRDDKERHVDGGKGFDILITNGDDTITFEGFEAIQGKGFNQTLTLDSDDLASNSKATTGLIVTDIDLAFSTEITLIDVDDLTNKQTREIERKGFDADEYHQVHVLSDGVEYTLLTNDDSFDVAFS
ncbi:hypothetical protein ACQEXU_09795 [Vibrio sp. TRT 21S02]|uniref:hypothetical protein n=1 Tax=Vibrio sp. TRT 21S02 TaxID=3418507 RepID=UPI003CF73F71